MSSRDVAAALGRHHKHVLRLLDMLANRRPDLIGRHMRYATFVGAENKTPFRCFHLDRTGLAAILDEVHDPAGAVLREAVLGRWPAEPTALAAPVAPRAPGPALDRDGLALMRIGGEVLTVDVGRWRGGAQARSVVFDYEGELTVERVDLDPLFTTVYGRRAGRALRTTMKPYQPGVERPVLWVLGTVIDSQPAAAPEAGSRTRARAPKPPRPRGASSAPALVATAVAGHA